MHIPFYFINVFVIAFIHIMFAIKLRQLFYISDKILVRNVRNRGRRIADDPGLSNRLKAFKSEGMAFQDVDAEEYIEQSESDFYDIGSTYNEHINETLIGKHDLQHHIVKDKYFKENMPNLLTWSEKEQIRHLATTEPDEWTPQRIAESFPVTEQTVKKLLKFPWKPASVQRIERHDASAMRNWRELKEGTLQISEDLRQHFLKFSNRNIPPLNKKSIKTDLTPGKNKMGEFEQIIRRCAEKEHTSSPDQSISNKNALTSKVIVEETKDFKKITLEELASKIKKSLDEGNNVDMSDKIIIDTINTKDEKHVSRITTELDMVKESKQENQLAEFKKPDDQVYKISYAERIRIPKKAYKKGATYKVNDCFYDDDGRFLYRVIGLTGS